MSRRLVALLTSTVALGSLSCQVMVAAPTLELPPVSAAPPSLETPVVEPDASNDEAIAQIVGYLTGKRGTGLADYEIEEVARTIAVEARRHQLDLTLVLAVIRVESRFDVYAVSPVGAMGLMQIMPSTGIELARNADVDWRGPQTLFDPIVNVRLGTAYLRELADRFGGDISKALAAYNWGPSRIESRIRRGRAVPTKYTGLVREAQSYPYSSRRS